MFKLMHKKLNKKGFTLAELLIVVAIIAILVAIAIPIFTQAMVRAQIRTNDANIRSTKAAAITEILDEWDVYKKGAIVNTTGGTDNPGWWAIGHVSPKGDLVSVLVYVNSRGTGNIPDATTYSYRAVSAVKPSYGEPNFTNESSYVKTFPKIPLDGQHEAGGGKWIAPGDDDYGYTSASSAGGEGYWTLVYIDNVEES